MNGAGPCQRSTYSRFHSCCRWWRYLQRPTRARRSRTRATGQARQGRVRTELLVRQAIFSHTSRHGHVCSPRSPRAGLDPPRNIAAARKPGNVCSSVMEFAIAIAHWVADKHRPPHPLTLVPPRRASCAAAIADDAMDLWGFKKWRRKLGYTQSTAGEKLGLSRGAVQYWESEIG